MKKIWYFNVIEFIYLIISLLIIIIFSFVFRAHFLSLVATIMGIFAAMINIKTKRLAFIFYAMYALIYGLSAFNNKLYGEGILNIIFCLPLYLFTTYKLYFRTNKNMEKNMDIKTLSIKSLIVIIILIPVVTILYGYILSILKSNLPYLNALATAFALISSFLASKIIKEQWFFWSLYDLVLIVIWLITFLNYGTSGIIYLILNIIYIGINIIGFLNWKKRYNSQIIK